MHPPTPPPQKKNKKKHHSNVPSNHHLDSLDPTFTFLNTEHQYFRDVKLPNYFVDLFVGKSRQVHTPHGPYSKVPILQAYANLASIREQVNLTKDTKSWLEYVGMAILVTFCAHFCGPPSGLPTTKRSANKKSGCPFFYICRFYQEKHHQAYKNNTQCWSHAIVLFKASLSKV